MKLMQAAQNGTILFSRFKAFARRSLATQLEAALSNICARLRADKLHGGSSRTLPLDAYRLGPRL